MQATHKIHPYYCQASQPQSQPETFRPRSEAVPALPKPCRRCPAVPNPAQIAVTPKPRRHRMRRKPRARSQPMRLLVNSSSCMRAHQTLAHAAFVPSCACAETFLTALPIDERAQSTQACGSAVAHHDAQHFLRVETARACSTMRRAGIVRNAIRGVFTMTCVQNQLLGACGCEYMRLVCHALQLVHTFIAQGCT